MINLRERGCPPFANGYDLKSVHKRLTMILETHASLRMLVLNGRIGSVGRVVAGVNGARCGCPKSKPELYP